jgi:putative phosphoribosyl transferase
MIGEVQERSIPPMGLPALVGLPPAPCGLVIFAHGSGSGRLSPRNNAVAAELRAAGLATLLFDLLTPAEARDRDNVFDIGLLAARLAEAARWAGQEPDLAPLRIGYFGASTGAAAALIAAADRPKVIRAVVCRGGRPDLARDALAAVRAPTLLIVGGADTAVMHLNQAALSEMHGAELAVVPGATHLFEEPGALEQVESLAASWFLKHLPAAAASSVGGAGWTEATHGN